MLLPLALALPWVAVLAFLLLKIRLPREIPSGPPARAPFVSVVVPARNEAPNIQRCVASLTASDYPDFEVFVVDDRSEDGTGDLVRGMTPQNARLLRVVEGAALPEGWLGKPWACAQGAAVAEGELLLFCDADTTHGPDLLGRAVAAMEEDRADLLTLLGRQLMGSFWERLVQPQVFLAMLFRFFDLERSLQEGSWRDAVANGQYLLFRRDAYVALGGHEAVKDEIVEDQAFAQIVVRTGRRLCLRMAETAFATRMYRSLPELVAGWSKNIVLGGLASVSPRVRPFVAPGWALVGTGLWLAPPVMLAAALLGVGGPGLLVWSGVTVGTSAVFWALFTGRMGAHPAYGFLYPLGAVVGILIVLRAWSRGRRAEWKGRSYVLKDLSKLP